MPTISTSKWGAKNATYQAWVRRGTDDEQALSLGAFYDDSAAMKCWGLEFADHSALGRIDAVFVTVEPNGGSQKPSSKPLLIAYLKVDPNHPLDRAKAARFSLDVLLMTPLLGAVLVHGLVGGWRVAPCKRW